MIINKLIMLFLRYITVLRNMFTLRLLDKIEITENSKDKYVLKYATTSKQKKHFLL